MTICNNIIARYGFHVDNFQIHQQEHTYFLTHLHDDHTQGLTKNWNFTIIHTTTDTAKLLRAKYPQSSIRIKSHHYYKWFPVNVLNETQSARICLIPAYHSFGSAIIIFDMIDVNGMLLVATGDYKGTHYIYNWKGWKSLMNKKALMEAQKTDINQLTVTEKRRGRVDVLMYDSSFHDQKYQLPDMKMSMKALTFVYDMTKLSRHKKSKLILLINTIGPEILLFDWLKQSKSRSKIKLWINPEHKNYPVLSQCFPPHIMTIRKKSAHIWIVQSNTQLCRLKSVNSKCPHICARISATWFLCKSNIDDKQTYPPPFDHNKQLYRINYSTHASFQDNMKLIQLLKPKVTKRCVPLIQTNKC